MVRSLGGFVDWRQLKNLDRQRLLQNARLTLLTNEYLDYVIARSSIIRRNLHTRMASDGGKQRRAISIHRCRSCSKWPNMIHRCLFRNENEWRLNIDIRNLFSKAYLEQLHGCLVELDRILRYDSSHQCSVVKLVLKWPNKCDFKKKSTKKHKNGICVWNLPILAPDPDQNHPFLQWNSLI